MATVGQMFNQVAAAMKAVDPSIKVGGPAFSYVGGNANDLSDFYGVAGASLDFASFHTYAYYRPMPTYTDSEIFDSAACSDGMQVSQGLSCFGAGKQILIAAGYRPDLEFYMDEFNINSYYNADANQAEDPRMTSIEGAIFDALVMINGVKSGLTGVLAWNESDGPNGFGKLGNSNRFLPSPAAYVYQAFNTYLRGSEYQSTSSNPKGVVPLAILSDTSFAVAMANRARNAAGEAMAQTVKVNISGPLNLGPNTLLSVYRVSAKGPQHQKDVSYNTLHNTGYKLPADTVTILTLPISGHAAGQINVR